MASKKSSKGAKKTVKSPAPKKAVKAAKAPAKAAKRAAPAPRKAPAPTMRSLTGQLVLGNAAKGMDWYAKCYGAKELSRMPTPDGRLMHATMQIGDTVFMLSDSFGQAPAEMSGAFLHIQHKDIQAMWDRAVANGAKVTLPISDMFWGDRYGQLRDPFGQMWSFGWPAKLTEAQKEKLRVEAMAQMAKR